MFSALVYYGVVGAIRGGFDRHSIQVFKICLLHVIVSLSCDVAATSWSVATGKSYLPTGGGGDISDCFKDHVCSTLFTKLMNCT